MSIHLASPKEFVDADSGLSKNSAKRSFRHIFDVSRYGHFATSPSMAPDFVTAWSRTVERVAKMPQPPDNISILEPGEPPH